MNAAMSKQDSNVALTLSPEVSQYFFTLRDRVLGALGQRGAAGHTLVVTSCHHGEGVSAVALNFALALAEADEHGKVLLCDANADSPAVHKVFQVEQSPGLTEAVAGQCEPEAAIRRTGVEALDILPVGDGRMSPSGIVDSPRLAPILAALKEEYRVVVLDAAPVIECSATARLAAASDGAVLVVEAERQRWEVAQRATDLLTDAGARIVGAVLNRRRFHIPAFLYDRL